MVAYIIRRLFQTIIVLVIVSFLIFIVIRLLPGDPLLIFLGEGGIVEASKEQIQALRAEYGLDQPLLVQYVRWVYGFLSGELGKSIVFGDDVKTMVAASLPITFHIGVLAFLLCNMVGMTAGVICAARRGKWIDTKVTVLANIGITVPVFWLGILLIYLFSLKLGWLPTYGYTSPFEDFWLSAKKVLMPAFCMSLFPMASIARQTRSSMLEVIRQDYVRTAWAKGLSEKTIIMRHVLKNGLIPVVTLNGMIIRLIFGGSVIIESVFNIPGLGRLLVESIFNQDYPVVQGGVLIIAVMIVIVNLIVDISYSWLDPRISYN